MDNPFFLRSESLQGIAFLIKFSRMMTVATITNGGWSRKETADEVVLY
jgi:hypothetical protein